MICKICDLDFKGFSGLPIHIKMTHKVTPKEYYDRFTKKGGEGICGNPNCSGRTIFKSSNLGYYKHCSTRCSNLDPVVRDKTKRTWLENYGVEHPMRSEKVKNCMEENWLKKYGVKNPNQLDEVKEKKKQTYLERYKVGNPNQAEFVKEKKKQTCLIKFGFDNPNKSEKIIKKRKKTILERYGFNHPNQRPEVRKSLNERMKNGGSAYVNSFNKNPSKPQVELYKSVKEIYPDAILNHPCLNYSIDIAILSLEIALEYDGSYYHQDLEYDHRRQFEIEQQGWKFIRYKDRIPTKLELLSDICDLKLEEVKKSEKSKVAVGKTEVSGV